MMYTYQEFYTSGEITGCHLISLYGEYIIDYGCSQENLRLV